MSKQYHNIIYHIDYINTLQPSPIQVGIKKTSKRTCRKSWQQWTWRRGFEFSHAKKCSLFKKTGEITTGRREERSFYHHQRNIPVDCSIALLTFFFILLEPAFWQLGLQYFGPVGRSPIKRFLLLVLLLFFFPLLQRVSLLEQL